MTKPVLVAWAALFLAGCVAVVPLVSDGELNDATPNYSRSIVELMIEGGPVPTEIYGNPTELEQTAFDHLVSRRLALPAVWGEHSFSTQPDPPPNHAYRIVLVFNPALSSANSPAEQGNAPKDSPRRHEFAICRGEVPVHKEGPYPALPVKRLEGLRTRRLTPVSPRFLQERLLVRGALCLGDVPISAAFVEVQHLEEFDVPEFDRLLAQLLLQLMPYRDESVGPANRT